MKILAFETSAKAASVALLEDGKLLAESYQNTGLTHSQTLMVMAEDMLKAAGKTAFTRGLARGLGCRELVTSPTYTIVNEYLGGRMPLFHFDMYRLHSSDDLWDIGWEDYLDRNGVCAVEWSENVADAMEDAIVITIEKLGEESRRITMEGGIADADLGI